MPTLRDCKPMLRQLKDTTLMLLGVVRFVLMLPLYQVLRLIEEVSRENRWYRQQKRHMEEARSLLPDAAFLESVGARKEDEPLWLAVRGAMAESVGLPAEAIHPQDRLADLWRMQWLGPDLLDVIFRLERTLGIKIPRGSIEEDGKRVRYGQPGDFREFAESVVQGLRELRRQAEARAEARADARSC